MVYLITYNLNKVGKNYESLYSSLRQYDYIRDNSLESVWFVSTSWTSDQIYEHLRFYFDTNDRLFITQIKPGEHYGYMHGNIWKWINSRI